MKLHVSTTNNIRIKIRDAIKTDKQKVLEFCINTFQWGDYIHEVWDEWYSDRNGVLLVAEITSEYNDDNRQKNRQGNDFVGYTNATENELVKKHEIIGVSHAHICPQKKQVWLEGIRIKPKFRRLSIATELIRRMISYGKEINGNIEEASAIIAQNNTTSRLMMEKNRFGEIAKWNYFDGYKDTLLRLDIDTLPNEGDNDRRSKSCIDVMQYIGKEVSFASLADTEEIIMFLTKSQTFLSTGRRYVQSWKWCELDLNFGKISYFIIRKQIVIVRSLKSNKIEGLAITTNNIHENQHTPKQQEYDDSVKKEEDYGDKSSVFQIGYLDAPRSSSLEALLVFIVNLMDSSNKYNRMQVFAPNQVHLEKHHEYAMLDELAKFGIGRSECFLLYNKRI